MTRNAVCTFCSTITWHVEGNHWRALKIPKVEIVQTLIQMLYSKFQTLLELYDRAEADTLLG